MIVYPFKINLLLASESHLCSRYHMQTTTNVENEVPPQILDFKNVENFSEGLWKVLSLNSALCSFPMSSLVLEINLATMTSEDLTLGLQKSLKQMIITYLSMIWIFFLWLHPWHMKFPGPGIESKPQL